MKSNYQYIAFTLFAFILLSGCTKEETSTSTASTSDSTIVRTVKVSVDQAKTVGLTITSISRMSLSGVVHVNGQLDVPPQNLVTISAPFGGFLKSTDMLQGKRVRAGEIVAVMENPEYIQMQQDYLDLVSQRDLAKAELARQEELAKENVNALKSLQQAKANFMSLDARTAGLKARLKIINIDADKLSTANELRGTINLVAPINGYVTDITATVGRFVNATDVIMKIVDPEHLHAELVAFEKDVLKLKVGQKVRFVLANEATPRTATVYLIGKEVTPQRTVRVHCHLDKEDISLIPGMYLSADIETGSEPTTVLPARAVLSFEGKRFVFVAGALSPDGSQSFTLTEATVGTEQNGFIEVSFDGMSDKVLVADSGAFDLLGALMNTEEE